MFLLHVAPQREDSNRLPDLMNPLSWIRCFNHLLHNSASTDLAHLLQSLSLMVILSADIAGSRCNRLTMKIEMPVLYQLGAQYQ